MEAGSLRRRVTIQQRVAAVQDSYGAEAVCWADVATVWAAVEPILGREFVEARQLTAELTTRIRIRYRAGITPAMRVLHGSEVYEVVSVQHVRSENREIVLMCRQILEV